MSAHRRPGSREEATPPRRSPGRRRTRSRTSKLLPIALGIVLVGIVATAGQRVVGNLATGQPDRTRIALAADQPELGLIYQGLEPAPRGAVCAGLYEVITPETCTHGPEPAPPGFTVAGSVKPVTGAAEEPVPPTRETATVPSDEQIARDEGGIALTPGAPALVPDPAPGEASFVMGPHRVACDGDGRSNKRVQVLYLHEFGTPSRYTQYVGSIRDWTAGVDGIIDAAAGETRGSRHVRFVTTPQCRVDVAEVQVPDGSLRSFTASITALQKLGYNRTDRKYLVYADANVYCGIGTFIADRRADLSNRNNGGPSYARVDAGCWSAAMATHELVHTLGAVLPGAPNSDGHGQCTDDYDLLCAPDPADGTAVREVCARKQEQRLDCNHDDYFSTAPKPGSFLAKNWNVARSEFLLQGDGGDELPSGVPSPAPGTARPAPAPAAVEARDATGTSVRLVWGAAAARATYEISVDGAPVARTASTRARLIGLRPDTRYTVTVRADAQRYSASTAVRTAPVARPAQDTWFVMTNSLTGGAVDLYAARTANGTPIVLNGADGDAQQQWKLTPAEDDEPAKPDAQRTFVLQSRATDKCVAPQGGNPVAGAPLVQVDCTTDGSQRWQVGYRAHGFHLLTAVGGLVVGVGTQRFGAHRVLVLQRPDDSRQQNWTALPG